MQIIYSIASLLNKPPSLPTTSANGTTVNTIFNIIFVILGALAILFVVLAGTRYTLSGGDPEKVQTAKNELKNALIGLLIVSLAAVIVKFIIGIL